jgi:uncharacterized membrane protein YfcA
MLQGSIGFGMGTLGVPLLLHVDPAFVPGPTLALAFILTILIYLRDRIDVRSQDIGWGILGRVLGTIAAMAVLSLISDDTLAMLAGVLVLGAVLVLASGAHVPISRPSLVAVGSVSGFMGSIASVGGPPMAMLYVGERGPRIRGTLSGIFIAGTASAVIGLILVGRFGFDELMRATVMLPALAVGFGLSRFTARILDRGYIRPAILVVSGIAALLAVIRYAI